MPITVPRPLSQAHMIALQNLSTLSRIQLSDIILSKENLDTNYSVHKSIKVKGIPSDVLTNTHC